MDISQDRLKKALLATEVQLKRSNSGIDQAYLLAVKRLLIDLQPDPEVPFEQVKGIFNGV